MLVFYIATAILLSLAAYVFYKTRSLYERGRTLPASISIGWLIVDSLDVLIVALSAAYGLWPLSLNGAVRTVGVALALSGAAIVLAGMAEFRSARRVLGDGGIAPHNHGDL